MRLVLLALLVLGCASTVHVSSAACDVSGEIATGTRVECAKDSVVIDRKSVSDSIRASGGMLGGALRMVLGGAAP